MGADCISIGSPLLYSLYGVIKVERVEASFADKFNPQFQLFDRSIKGFVDGCNGTEVGKQQAASFAFSHTIKGSQCGIQIKLRRGSRGTKILCFWRPHSRRITCVQVAG
jgi:hypothetical protein